jgi:uncharacterized protein (TIGR03118 family)
MKHLSSLVLIALAGCGGAAGGESVALRRGAGYTVRNLVSDGFVTAEHLDANLVNAWGITPNPNLANGLWWVANEATGTSTLYDGEGVADSLVVSVPGNPTGIVFNGGSGFEVTDGTNSGPARFLFASLDGTISGWSPAVPPPPPSTQAFVVVDSTDEGAVYTGLAIDGDRIYAADFANARVEVYDDAFAEVELEDGFVAPRFAMGYAPFGIQAIGGTIYVTYALQDEDDPEEEVARAGAGFVVAYDRDGAFEGVVAAHGQLNAPWGIAFAPSGFGPHSGHLLVGNLGDGRINAYEKTRGGWRFAGPLLDAGGHPIEIEGLWGIAFGTGGPAGPTNTLFFAAGPEDETHGLFGRIDAP